MTTAGTIGEVSRAAGRWNHNVHYHRIVLDALPPGIGTVLDVGTGDGLLAAELTPRVRSVVGIDLGAEVLARAADEAPDVEWVCGDVLTHDLGRRFDAVVSIATLHHLPDPETGLRRMADLVAPGGVLVVVGLARSSTPVDVAYDVAGSIQHRVLSRRFGFWEHSAPKVWTPEQTYREVRDVVADVLPGARWRRLPLFRYAVVWTKPTGGLLA